MDTAYDPAWLTKAMTETGFGVSELATAAGVSRSQIQRIRNGMPPRMDTQVKLRAALATKTQAAPRKRRALSQATA